MIFDLCRQQFITHILLINMETESTVVNLALNAFELNKHFCDIFYPNNSSSIYKLIIVFPESRSDLENIGLQLKPEMLRSRTRCVIQSIKKEDMFLIKGKAGLLACSLYLLAGAILLNDRIISPENAELILTLANKDYHGVYPIDPVGHAAIILGKYYIGPGLAKLPERHELRDILEVMDPDSVNNKLSLGSGKQAKKEKRPKSNKWWQLWK